MCKLGIEKSLFFGALLLTKFDPNSTIRRCSSSTNFKIIMLNLYRILCTDIFKHKNWSKFGTRYKNKVAGTKIHFFIWDLIIGIKRVKILGIQI